MIYHASVGYLGKYRRQKGAVKHRLKNLVLNYNGYIYYSGRKINHGRFKENGFPETLSLKALRLHAFCQKDT